MVRLSEEEKFILRQAVVKILLVLKYNDGVSMTYVSKKADLTFSQTVKVLGKMEKLGLVSFEKIGRIKLTYLTEKGKEVAQRVEELMKSLKK